MPELSIIIPSYQRVDLLEACLRSIVTAEQGAIPAWLQVIVVDDASTESAVTATARKFDGIQVYRLAKRSGFCAAINAGLSLAQAPVVQVLNDDTEVLPGWYHVPLNRFRQNSRLGSVAPLVLQWTNSNLIDSAGDGYDPGGFAYSHGRGEVVTDNWMTSRIVFSAPASAAFYRRDALRHAGGFPEEMVAYFDDLDVGFRLRQAGYTCLYEPASRVLHHGSASHGKRPGRRLTQQLSCNEERLFCRYQLTDLTLSQLARHAAVLLMKATRRWADGTLIPFMLGRCQAWSEMVAIYASPRASLQRCVPRAVGWYRGT